MPGSAQQQEVTAASLEAFFARYRRDPVAFVREQFVPSPTISDDQLDLLNDVGRAVRGEDKRYISVVSGTSTGKTACLAWLVLWGLSCHSRARIPCTASTRIQVLRNLWGEIRRWHPYLRPLFQQLIDIRATSVRQTDNEECFAEAIASQKNKPENFQGIHCNFLMFLMDEASGIPQSIFDAAEGNCTSVTNEVAGGCALLICTGNGNYASGPFFETHHKNARYWKHRSWSSRNSPFCGKDYITRQEEVYGPGSNQIRIRIDGLFPTDDPDTLIQHDWAQSAVGREIREPTTVQRIAGLDPKGAGGDTIGFCIRQGHRAYGFDEWPRSFEEAQIAGRLVQMYRNGEFDLVCVDAIGVGSGVCSMLEQAGVPHRRVNVGAAAMKRALECYRLRDELWWEAREWFRAGDVGIDVADSDVARNIVEKAIHELTTPKYAVQSNGRIVVESKDSLRRGERLGYSPGLADAFCLTFADLVPVIRENRPYFNALPSVATMGGGFWDGE